MSFSEKDHYWMQYALNLAKTAAEQAEVPVGAVLVADESVVGKRLIASVAEESIVGKGLITNEAIVCERSIANEAVVCERLIANEVIIGEGWNRPIVHCDPTAHAEILALRQGAETLNNYRLINTTLYVTLEPCLMCVGAIVHARVQRVVFGAYDPRAGAVASAFQLGATDLLNHRVNYQGGLLAAECGAILKDFFKKKRGHC